MQEYTKQLRWINRVQLYFLKKYQKEKFFEKLGELIYQQLNL